MRGYPKYKDSGIEWLGEIPEHWEIFRFKYVLPLNTEKINHNKLKLLRKIALEHIESWTGKLYFTASSFEGEGVLFKEQQKIAAYLDHKTTLIDILIEKKKRRIDLLKEERTGRMYSLGEMNFIQGMLNLGNCKNSVGLKPNAELRKDAKAPSINKS